MVKFWKCNQLKTSPKREDHKKTQPLASLSFQLSNQITRSTTSGHERILQSRDCPRRIHGQRQTQNQRLCSYLLFSSCMSHLALSVGVMTESVGTELCKSYTNKNRRYCVHCSSEISSDFRVKARGKILTCTSRHVARAKSDYSSNFRFRTKIRDEKSLENTKQFSAQHNQSTCHVMSTKHEIKMSWCDKFRTAFVVF